MRAMMLAVALGAVWVTRSWAESGLPEYTIGAPEGAAPQAAFDLRFDLARRIGAASDGLFDPPSTGWLNPARARLAATIAAADAEAEAVMGPASRGMAEYLAQTLFDRQQALGWEAMAEAAIRSVALERQLSANAVLLGGFLPDTWEAAATGVQTTALEDVLFALAYEAEAERSLGLASPTRSEALAFWLAQAAFTGETAMAALRRQRRYRANYAEAEVFARVQDLQVLLAELTYIDQLIAEGLGFPDPDATLDSVRAGTERGFAGLQRLIAEQVDVADALFPWLRSVGDAQRALRADEALVMIVPAGAHVLLFAVTADGFAMRRAGSDQSQLMEQGARVRAAVGWSAGRSAVPLPGAEVKPTKVQMLRDEAWLAYAALLQPVEFLVRDRLRLLVVATARVGMNLPFELMLTAPAPPGAADRDLPWLVRRHAVVQVPSVDLLWQRNLPPRLPPGETWYAGFGDPDYALPSELGRSNLMTRMLAGLRPLADSAAEVGAVAAAFGEGRGLAVTGKDASEYLIHSLNADGILARFSVLHFATHGLVWGDHPDVVEPMLALTPMLDLAELARFEVGTINLPRPDGALEAYEIRQLDLRARLVILSACSTGRVEFDQDGLASLASAFLAAGAERVLGTHWPVYSEAAVEIVTGMAARDPLFADPAMALRDTLLSVIDQGGRKADPGYWAAFSLVGRP